MTRSRRKRRKLSEGNGDDEEKVLVDLRGNDTDATFRRSLADLWRDGTLCDIDVVVDGRTFSAHRLVLASGSDYMRALLGEDRFKDSSEGTIELKSTTSDLFATYLEWNYTGRCTADEKSLFALLETASFLQSRSFMSVVETEIEDRLTSDNSLETLDKAETMGLDDLADGAETIVAQHFGDVSKKDGFMSLSASRLLKLISRDDLEVKNEEDVFGAVIGWAKAQQQQPQMDEMGKLFSHVRFPLMSEKYITEIVETEELLLKNPEGMLAFARSFKADKFGQKARPRGRMQEEKDIRLVMGQAQCSWSTARRALREKNGDLVDAIMSLVT